MTILPCGKDSASRIKDRSTSRTSRNLKGTGLSGKFQIPNNGVSFGQVLNAFGEEHTAAFLSLKVGGCTLRT
jgi:hypothetical protein